MSTNTAISVMSNILRGPADPYVLPETPWVLSIGRRVMEMGYTFVWIAGAAPWLVSPCGRRLDLEVHGNIPFLPVGEAAEEAMEAKAVPRVTPVQADEDNDDEVWCVPVKVKTLQGCSHSQSSLVNHCSVIVLDSDEEDQTSNGEILNSAHENQNDEILDSAQENHFGDDVDESSSTPKRRTRIAEKRHVYDPRTSGRYCGATLPGPSLYDAVP